ncbi:hypothetical protein E2562_036284, partial [Oryza meyeriana var. granulata]
SARPPSARAFLPKLIPRKQRWMGTNRKIPRPRPTSGGRQTATGTPPKTPFLIASSTELVHGIRSVDRSLKILLPFAAAGLANLAFAAMCGDCCGRRPRGAGEAGAAARGGRSRGCAGTALALVALAAAVVVAVLEGTAGGVSYVGDGWLHECAKWDAEGQRLLVSNFFGAGVSELRAETAGKGKEKEEERVVLADPDAAGRVALGLAIDEPRQRLLVVYADRMPRFGYSAVAAYELASWRRLFLTRLDGPGDSTLADDVAVDEDGNTYVTDAKGNKIWKVSPDGEPLSVIKNATFFQRPGWINNFVGLNGIVYHPNGYLLVIHTSGGDLFKVDPKTGSVHVVKVQGSLKTGDGLALLSPTRLVAAGLVSRLVESNDDWETATVTGRYVGPAHRIGSAATVKDGDVYINHIIGFGFGFGKKTHVISKAVFAPL